jgi:hypothetical protein
MRQIHEQFKCSNVNNFDYTTLCLKKFQNSMLCYIAGREREASIHDHLKRQVMCLVIMIS